MINQRTVGSNYERAAGYFLEQKGMKILEYNYRCRIGEIDLIAQDKDQLVFIEVKYRRGSKAGNPLEAVTYQKQRKIIYSAKVYLMEHGIPEDQVFLRFDVIGIEGSQITHLENAFGL